MTKVKHPTTITLDEVKARCKKAYLEGRLTAQSPEPDNRRCVYTFDGHVCAIGAALDPATLKEVVKNGDNSSCPVRRLIDTGYLEIDGEARGALRRLQAAHDEWANRGRLDWSLMAKRNRDAERAFVKLLGIDATGQV